MPRNLKKCLYFLLGGLGGIVVIFIIFVGTAIFQAKYYLETFLEEAPQNGIPIGYGKVVTQKYFPQMVLKIKKLGVDGWYDIEGEAQESTISYSLFHPHTLTIRMPTLELKYLHHTIALNDLEITLDPFSYGDGEINISFQKASLMEEETLKGSLEKGHFSLHPKVIEASNDKGTYKIPSLVLKGEGKEVHLNKDVLELGQTIKDIAVRATIQESLSLLPKGNMSLQDCLKLWREQGGAVDIEKLSFTWGSLLGGVEGTFALDMDLFPEGAFTFHVKGISVFLRNLVKNKKMPPDQRVIVQMALGLLEASTHNNFILPVTLQNKKIRAGDFLEISLK